MRYLRGSLFIVTAAIVIGFIRPEAAPIQATQGLAAYRAVCGADGRKLVTDIQTEIRAAKQQPAWTPAEEQQRIDNVYREAAAAPADQRSSFLSLYREIWKEAEPFIQQPDLILTACAVTVVDNWNAGVRDVPGLSQKWAAARVSYAAGSVPAGATPQSGTRIQTAPSQSPSAPLETPRPSPPADRAAGTSSDTVDCVQFDRPGRFRNDCGFDVYFTYCGVEPEEGSYVTPCAPGRSFGLHDIGAHGFQAGFTRAKLLKFFECRSPHTPQEVEYKDDKLYGYCK